MVLFNVLRTRCQWKMLPDEYGSGFTFHRSFQEWVRIGISKRIWINALENYDDKQGIEWAWKSLDSTPVKSPLGWQ
jgi:transposase